MDEERTKLGQRGCVVRCNLHHALKTGSSLIPTANALQYACIIHQEGCCAWCKRNCTLQQIHREHLLLPVVVISGSDDTEDALQAIGAGAVGYVPQRSDLNTLVEALQLVLAGGTYVPPLKPLNDVVASVAAAAPPSQAWAELPLTPRQKGVLDQLARGLSNKEIARELNVSVDTVKDHVAAVLKALGASSRTQAVLIATQKSR